MIATAVVPLVTVLDPARRPDAARAEPLLAYLTEAGITTLMLLGSNGEGPSIPADDAAAYTAGIRTRWPGPMLATAAGVSTVDAVRRAQLLADAGADAIVAMPPLYYRHTVAELVAHFGAIADLGRPVVIYDQPTYTGNPLTLDIYVEVLAYENVLGVKISRDDPALLEGLVDLRSHGRRFAIASGRDRGMIAALQHGADGLVLGTTMLAPRACLQLIASVRGGDLKRATELQGQLESLLDIHRIRPGTSGIVATKAALDELGLCTATTTAPFQPFGESERRQLRHILDNSPIVTAHMREPDSA